MEDNSKIIFDIHTRVTRMEEKLDSLTDAKKVADEGKEIANTALQYGKSAHKRLDKIDRIIFWLGTTVVGAVVVGIVSYFMKG